MSITFSADLCGRRVTCICVTKFMICAVGGTRCSVQKNLCGAIGMLWSKMMVCVVESRAYVSKVMICVVR